MTKIATKVSITGTIMMIDPLDLSGKEICLKKQYNKICYNILLKVHNLFSRYFIIIEIKGL
jgi:hypothetical protein